MQGSKRCADYSPNGSCARPDEFMCVEWLKLNPASAAEKSTLAERPVSPKPLERDLFGAPDARPAPKPRATPSPSPAVTAPPQTNKPLSTTDTPVVRAVTEADVASFKAESFEVCLESESLGPVWIVTEYSDRERMELKLEHAVLLAAVGSVFPDARVTVLRRSPERGRDKSPGA